MATPNRWAIRDVAIASFFDLTTGELKLKLDTLKTSGLENTSSIVYAMGGRGNPKLVGFSSDKAAKFTLEDAVFSNDLLAMLTGNDIVEGITKVQHSEVVPVTTNSATLTYTPSAAGALISVNKLNADGTKGKAITYAASTPTTDHYSVSSKTLTFGSSTFAAGESALVYYYTNSAADAKKIRNTTDKFAGTYRLVLDCLVRDIFYKKDYAAQIEVFNAKLDDSSWNLAMANTGDPSTLSIPLEALKSPTSTDLYTMTIFDESDLA